MHTPTGKKKPSVSYILCVQNGAATLRPCIESLLSQEGIDLEIIIINDGSSDDSLSVLSEYKRRDKRIKLFSQKNRGLPITRNIGISRAFGDYIASAAQDDVYLPEKTIEQINFMEKNRLDFAYTNIRTINEKGEFIKFRSMRDYNARLLPFPFSLVQIALYSPICSPTFICKRYCYEKIHWNPGFISASDLNLTLKMFLHFRGRKLEKNLLLRRIRLKEHTRFYEPFYSKRFLRTERKLAIICAFLQRLNDESVIPRWPNYFKVIRSILTLEKNSDRKFSFRELARIYAIWGYTQASEKMIYLSNVSAHP